MGLDHPDRLAALALLAVCGTLALGDVVYTNDFGAGPVGEEWSRRDVGVATEPFGAFLGNFGRETVTLTLGRGTGGPGGGGDNPGPNGPVVASGGMHEPVIGNRSGGGRNPGGLHASPTRPFFDNGDGGGGNPDPGVGSGRYLLTFDLCLFDTWDGLDATYGVDRFRVEVNGTSMFSEVLETFEPWENSLDGWELAGSGAYNTRYRDLIYRDLSIEFTVSEPGRLLVIDFISEQNQPTVDESWGLDRVRVTRDGRSSAVPTPGSVALLASAGMLWTRRRR